MTMYRALLVLGFVAALQFMAQLLSLWSSPEQIDEGCIMDPNGRCLGAPAPQSDAGCIMDPSGGCSKGS